MFTIELYQNQLILQLMEYHKNNNVNDKNKLNKKNTNFILDYQKQ